MPSWVEPTTTGSAVLHRQALLRLKDDVLDAQSDQDDGGKAREYAVCIQLVSVMKDVPAEAADA